MRILNDRKFDYNNDEIDELAMKKLVELGCISKDVSDSLKKNLFNNVE